MWKKPFNKYWFIFALIVFGAAIGILSVGSNPKDREGQLIIGLQSGYPPFEFRDVKGDIVGFDVDVGKEIATHLGKKLIIKDMEFEGTILSLKQGKIDLILSGMNITPTRLKEILMIPYHGEAATSLSLIFWGEIPKEVHKLEDIESLPGGSISVESGAIPEAYMFRYPFIPVKSFHGALNPLMDVKYGKSTANLVEPDVAVYLKSLHPEISILDVPIAPDEQIAGFGIGVKKENHPLFEQVSAIIDDLKQSGKLKQLEDKWFKGGGHE